MNGNEDKHALLEDRLKELYYDNRTLYAKNKHLEYKIIYLEKRISILWFLVIYLPIIIGLIMGLRIILFD